MEGSELDGEKTCPTAGLEKTDRDATTSLVLECYKNSFMLRTGIGRPTLPKKRHFMFPSGI